MFLVIIFFYYSIFRSNISLLFIFTFYFLYSIFYILFLSFTNILFLAIHIDKPTSLSISNAVISSQGIGLVMTSDQYFASNFTNVDFNSKKAMDLDLL